MNVGSWMGMSRTWMHIHLFDCLLTQFIRSRVQEYSLPIECPWCMHAVCGYLLPCPVELPIHEVGCEGYGRIGSWLDLWLYRILVHASTEISEMTAHGAIMAAVHLRFQL